VLFKLWVGLGLRVRFKGRVWVRTTFWDRNVDPGSTKYVDPGPCLMGQNHGDR